MEGCCHLIVPPPPTAAAEKLQGKGESTRRRAGGAGGPGHQPELWLQLGAAQGTFYGQTGQGDHCSKPARVVHLAGQELPPANSGLEAAGMRGPTRTARQGAARPGTPSTVQMEAGDVGSRNAVSDPAQAKHGPILSSPGAEPGPGSPRPRRLLAVLAVHSHLSCALSSLKIFHTHYLIQAPSRLARADRQGGYADLASVGRK